MWAIDHPGSIPGTSTNRGSPGPLGGEWHSGARNGGRCLFAHNHLGALDDSHRAPTVRPSVLRELQTIDDVVLESRHIICSLQLTQRSLGELQMRNPWLKKNPFMSMWMSGANSVMGAARSRATAEGKRQAATMMSHGTKEVARFWTNALMPSTRKHKKSR